MKDPAFLFYTSDFLTGTMFMTNEQVGLYIRLLCAQHQHGGRIDTNVLRSQCDGITGGALVYSKFQHDENGSFNPRLAEEMAKRAVKSKKAKESAEQRWKKPQSERNANALRFEDVNESVNENEVKGGAGGKEPVHLPFDSDEFREAWNDWKEYKQKQHGFKYKHTKSEEQGAKQLATMANGNERKAIDMIHRSMANGWKGFHPAKEEEQGETMYERASKALGQQLKNL